MKIIKAGVTTGLKKRKCQVRLGMVLSGCGKDLIHKRDELAKSLEAAANTAMKNK